MAISVDPLTNVIFVPRNDLTLLQASPEVRSLDIDWFRLELLDWEDGVDAITRPNTHSHNTEVTLAGLTYARIVEILPPYTVEFEDGQYTVNCVGANHNISDRKVANQVSLIVNNAAGLITNAAIEFSSFNGYVTIDTSNRTGKATDGTVFPAGTRQAPSDNIADALLIASVRGLKGLFLESSLNITAAVDIRGFVIEGNNHVDTELTIAEAAMVDNVKVIHCTIHDTVLDGDIDIEHCVVRDVSYVNGHIHDSGLSGVIALGGSRESVLESCYTIDQDNPPIVDMGSSGNDLAMPNYSGIVIIRNLQSADEEVGIGLNAGMVTFEDTVTAGTAIVAGNGEVINNAGPGFNLNVDALMNVHAIATHVWEYDGAPP